MQLLPSWTPGVGRAEAARSRPAVAAHGVRAAPPGRGRQQGAAAPARPQRRRPITLRGPTCKARAVPGESEDLMQFPDRVNWYETKFAADDMPEWNPATLVRRAQLAPGVASLTLLLEASRERVPLRSAYTAAGQRAALRANGGLERAVPVASAPPGADPNEQALFLVRGDIFAGDTKTTREPVSLQVEVEVVVTAEEAPELYAIQVDDQLEAGPFQGTGLDLRSSGVLAAFRFPTVVLFVSGPAGIAAARALLEAPPDVAGLAPALRGDVVVYYTAPNESSFLFRDAFKAWAAAGPVRVVTSTRGFGDAFDGDDLLMYDPPTTAALILTGGDAEAEAAAREVCAEAEITAVVADSEPAPAPVYLASSPKSFRRWAARSGGGGEAAGDGGEREGGEAGGGGSGEGAAGGGSGAKESVR